MFLTDVIVQMVFVRPQFMTLVSFCRQQGAPKASLASPQERLCTEEQEARESSGRCSEQRTADARSSAFGFAPAVIEHLCNSNDVHMPLDLPFHSLTLEILHVDESGGIP